MTVLEKIKSGFTFLDGAMGTELQKKGLKMGELPERFGKQNPDIVIDIHSAYLDAGSDIISANTFGANSLKYADDLEDIIASAINSAKIAASRYDNIKPRFVALDIGPLGKMLKPLGDLDFETAVEIFAKTVTLGVKYGADLILIETMNDAYETKAAVLAAKENSNLPIFVTNVYDKNQKLMTGASPKAMVALLEGLRVDALGLNCSLGPNEMKEIVTELVNNASVPVIVKPNAGLPSVKNGETVFDISAKTFAESMREIAQSGATILGGCCGTNPEYIKALCHEVKGVEPKKITAKSKTVISSYTHAVEFNETPILIGERINPTGKKRFKQALIENDITYILNEGISQAEAGVDVLDVNVGLPDIDEIDFMRRTVTELQAVTDLPLQIDSAKPEAIENALRIYNGKPMINSVNGKQSSMDSVLPLVAKYGGVVVALTLDENGIPNTAEERVHIAEKIIAEAKKYGIDKKDIIVDPLTLAVSADSFAGCETLKAVKLLKQRGIKTSLGVSNVSFGLPNRDFVTSTFFALALENGLNAAIMNPYSVYMMSVYHSFLTLKGLDDNCKRYIEFASKYDAAIKPTEVNAQIKSNTDVNGLFGAVVKGLKVDAKAKTAELLKTTEPMEIINEHIIPALDEVGKGFEAKTVYLPQLLMSAEAATAAFDEVKRVMAKKSSASGGKIILATVQGDIHDIGKNIVKVLLENYGFDVLDLGRDVPPETIVQKAITEKAAIVGLSALMTTTVESMEKTIKLLKQKGVKAKTVVGGAVLNKDYADKIGADFYAKTAMDTVRFAEKEIKADK